VIIYAASVKVYSFLIPIALLEHPAVKVIGFGLLLLSLIWTLLAQAQMGKSWRIGIDVRNKTELVQGGVFRLSRNPIFLGMIATLTGMFLVMPNALTLLTLILGYVLIQIQVRLEEEHLTSIHGENYLEYRRRVRRWL
jgi:protein-S-isoprenylcysteine O-methyltransferase Ste14